MDRYNLDSMTGKSAWILLLLILPLCFMSQGALANTIVRYHVEGGVEEDTRNDYFYSMLRLALHKTRGEDGSFRLKAVKATSIGQGRAIQLLGEDELIDVMWTMTTNERETQLLPVRIPLLKGLLGYRILIIRKSDKDKFANLGLAELKNLIAVQGTDWPDLKILAVNDFTVESTRQYTKMFDSVARGEKDYFPRSVTEIWGELDQRKNSGLMAEETMILKYKAPIYFFVSKNNKKLADRIERGLRLAMEDGSFDKLFFRFPSNQKIFSSAKMKRRKIYELDNPFLPPETPLDEEGLWYSP